MEPMKSAPSTYYTKICQALNSMFDGYIPYDFVPTTINGVDSRTLLRETNLFDPMEEPSFVPPIEEIVKTIRQEGNGRALSRHLMPLYRELLFDPQKRMSEYGPSAPTAPLSKKRIIRRELLTVFTEIFLTEEHLTHLFDGYDLYKATKQIARFTDPAGMRQQIFIHALAAAFIDGYETDWAELHFDCLKHIHTENNTIISLNEKEKRDARTRLVLILISFASIMLFENSSTTAQKKLITQLRQQTTWQVMGTIYTLLLQKPLFAKPGVSSIDDHLMNFAANFPQFMHLVIRCLKENTSLTEKKQQPGSPRQMSLKTLNYVVTKNIFKSNDNSLNYLYIILFPKNIQEIYRNENPFLSTYWEIYFRGDKQLSFPLFDADFTNLDEMTNFEDLTNQNETLNESLQQAERKNDELESENDHLKAEVKNLKAKLVKAVSEAPSSAPKAPTRDCIYIDDLLKGMRESDDVKSCEMLYQSMSFLLSNNETWKKHMHIFMKTITEMKRTANAPTLQNVQINLRNGAQNNMPSEPGKK